MLQILKPQSHCGLSQTTIIKEVKSNLQALLSYPTFHLNVGFRRIYQQKIWKNRQSRKTLTIPCLKAKFRGILAQEALLK
jgi:hypothetical protein